MNNSACNAKLTLQPFVCQNFTISVASWAFSLWQIILWSEHRSESEMGICGWLSFSSASFLPVRAHTQANDSRCAWYCKATCVAKGWRYYQFVSMLSHPSDTCHQHYFHRCCLPRSSPLRHAPLSRLIRLAARRLSTLPHLSLRGQGCRQITSLAFHLCHAGLLPLWQLAAVFSRRKKKSTGLRRAGWEPNNSWQCARHWTVILMAAVGMYGPEVTHKRPASICSCRAGK